MHLTSMDLFLQTNKDPNQLKGIRNIFHNYNYFKQRDILKFLNLPTESLWIKTFNGGCLISKFPINADIINISVGGAIKESLAIRLTNAATSSSGKWL